MTPCPKSSISSTIRKKCEEPFLLQKPMILDVHTHTLPSQLGTAIVSANLDSWKPQPDHWYALGIHPWNIVENGEEQLRQLRTLLLSDTSEQIRMVGEMGLDKMRGPAMDVQRSVFIEQLKIALSIGKNPVIHDVHCMAEILAIRRELRYTQPWLIHGFRGGPEQARQYLRAGCHVSLGPRFRLDTLLSLPFDELFLESDDQPEKLKRLYDDVSQQLNMPIHELEQQVNDNVLHLLNN